MQVDHSKTLEADIPIDISSVDQRNCDTLAGAAVLPDIPIDTLAGAAGSGAAGSGAAGLSLEGGRTPA